MQKKYEEMIIFVLADTANVRRLVVIDMVRLAALSVLLGSAVAEQACARPRLCPPPRSTTRPPPWNASQRKASSPRPTLTHGSGGVCNCSALCLPARRGLTQARVGGGSGTW
jgi:hypothetical protein